MNISVLIISWNNKSDLKNCLNSLLHQTENGFEIIVVDNNSNDGTVEMIRQNFPNVILIEETENLGFAEGCNRGISISTGEWIATLNQDTTVEPDWMAELTLHAQSAESDLGMLQSQLLFMDEPQLINSTGILLTRNAGGMDRDFRELARKGDPVEEIFCPTAGAAMYRREMLDQVRLKSGYFDRTFFMYWEDLDLGWRCRLAGWRSLYIPTAIVYHRFQGSSKIIGKRYAEFQCRKNRLRGLLKNGSFYLMFRSSEDLVRDFLVSLKHRGLVAIPNLFSAIYDGLRQRAEVTELVKINRRELEIKWTSGTRQDAT